MLTQFDNELYPNDCEVVEMPLHNQCVFLIQKNGSSSLRRQAKLQNLTILRNEQLLDLDSIDVYIRNPLERYLSGLNTYLQHLQRDNQSLDYNTCLWFATRYPFLNRHYLPQIHWIINLSRFIRNDCKLKIRNFSTIGNITKHNSKAGIQAATDSDIMQFKQKMHPDIELFLFLDQMILDMADQEYTFLQMLDILHAHPAKSWSILTERFLQIAQKITLP